MNVVMKQCAVFIVATDADVCDSVDVTVGFIVGNVLFSMFIVLLGEFVIVDGIVIIDVVVVVLVVVVVNVVVVGHAVGFVELVNVSFDFSGNNSVSHLQF